MWEMHAGTPDAALTQLEPGSESEEDVERELEHSMSRHLGSEDRQGSLKGRLHLRWLWLAFWAGAFLRERFGDVRWENAGLLMPLMEGASIEIHAYTGCQAVQTALLAALA